MVHAPLTFEATGQANLACAIHLDLLYPKSAERKAFDERWKMFLDADDGHAKVLCRTGHVITYSHKSWLPRLIDSRPPVLFVFGNPAPHSVLADVYFSYEGNGAEHRFWRVLRELGFTDLSGVDRGIKDKFLNLAYETPFRLGLEVIYTFPTSASRPKWSGVVGVQRLFGRRAMETINDIERERLRGMIARFFANGARGAIVAMQKSAYDAVAANVYSIRQAMLGDLASDHDGIPVYGTPPTRWLHTAKVKAVLLQIRAGLLPGS
jgi:hypothetical protein